MVTSLTPAEAEAEELQRMQHDSLADLHLPEHTVNADQLADSLRNFIKYKKFREHGLRDSRRSERKQIAEDFLDAIRPDGSSNRSFFWPKYEVDGADDWPGELKVQETIADWIYLEVGKRPGKRPKLQEAATHSMSGGPSGHALQGHLNSTIDELEDDETDSSPEGDIPHSEELSERVAGKRKSNDVDIFDIDFDAFLPRGDAATADKAASRPRKLVRFTSQRSKAEQSQTQSKRDTIHQTSPSSSSLPRTVTEFQSSRTSDVIIPTPTTESAREASSSIASPEAAKNLQIAQVGTAQPSSLPRPENATNAKASQIPQPHPRPVADVRQTHQLLPDAGIRQIPYLFLERMEEKERAHYDEAQASENLDDSRLALTKARVLRDMRDELKAVLRRVTGKATGMTLSVP